MPWAQMSSPTSPSNLMLSWAAAFPNGARSCGIPESNPNKQEVKYEGKSIATTILALGLASVGSPVLAQGKEVSEVRIAQQFGLAFLPLMVMDYGKLIEKHGQRLGLPGLKSVFTRISSTQGLNDALIAGQVDFVANGAPSVLTLWSRTLGTANEIKGVIPINEIEFWLKCEPARHKIVP